MSVRGASVLAIVLCILAIAPNLDLVFAINQDQPTKAASICHDGIWDDGEFCGRDAYTTTGFPDLNHDCLVDALDIALFLVQHNATGPNLSADLTGDGIVEALGDFQFFGKVGRRVSPCNITPVPGSCQGKIALSFSPDSTTIVNNVSQGPGIYTAYVVINNYANARIVEYALQPSYNVQILDHRPRSGEWIHGCEIGHDRTNIVFALAAPLTSGPAIVAMIRYLVTDTDPATIAISPGDCRYRRIRWSTADVSVSHDFEEVLNAGINGPTPPPTPCPAAFGTIVGRVYEDRGNDCDYLSGTDLPIAHRTVEINPGGYIAITDDSGIYTIAVPEGAYTVGIPAIATDPWKTMSDCQPATYNVNVVAQVVTSGNDFGLKPVGTISGQVYRDVDVNCEFDEGIDWPIANRLIQVDPGYFALTDALGNFSVLVAAGQYSVSQATVSNDIWSLQTCQTSASYQVNVLPDGSYSGNDFALEGTGPCDVAVNIVSNGIGVGPPPCSARILSLPCPGVEHEYLFVVVSRPWSGSQTAVGALLDITLGSAFTISAVSSDFPISPVSSSGPNQRTVQLDAGINPGQVCVVKVRATPTAGGPYVTQMTFADAGCTGVKTTSISETDQCSCDPNDMSVAPKGCGAHGGIIGNAPLTYKIRFENIGPGRAHNIYVKDILDGDLDLGSLHVLAASDEVTGVQIDPGNKLVISFDGIELPGTYNPQDNNKGFVIFMIDPKENLVNGTTITNLAQITFDFNDPVITNMVLNTIQSPPCPTTGIPPDPRNPTATSLGQNHPNPFNPSTSIEYALASAEDVTISVYNVNGELVQTLVDDRLPAGWHTADWNGRDRNGSPVASGVYLYRMRAGSFVNTKKLVLLK